MEKCERREKVNRVCGNIEKEITEVTQMLRDKEREVSSSLHQELSSLNQLQ